MIIREAEVEDLGPALAVEDALTVLVVILVLRVVLFVPLMSMDRARLEHAEKDDYWQGIYSRVLGSRQESKFTGQYEDAFDIGGKSTVVTSLEGDRVRYIEAADGNDNLLVIRHEVGRQSYSSMFIQKFSTVPSFSHGQIKWSPQEKKWFTLNNRVDYAQTPESMALRKDYLEWARGLGSKP